ncbi:hypothetical protein WA158_005540 [Blastocystis sp. Blastoise]
MQVLNEPKNIVHPTKIKKETYTPDPPKTRTRSDLFRSFIITDKTLYKPRDYIFATYYLLNAYNYSMIEDTINQRYVTFTLSSSMDVTVDSYRTQLINSTAHVIFKTKSISEGVYHLSASIYSFKTTTNITVINQKNKGLMADVTLDKTGYSQGDSVNMTIHILRNFEKDLDNIRFSIYDINDSISNEEYQIPTGTRSIQVPLSENFFARADPSQGGVPIHVVLSELNEKVTIPVVIPQLSNDILVDLYPESDCLLENYKQTIIAYAHNSRGEAASVPLTFHDGDEVMTHSTNKDGLASFTSNNPGNTYITVTKDGIEKKFQMQQTDYSYSNSCLLVSLDSNIIHSTDIIKGTITAGKTTNQPGPLTITIYRLNTIVYTYTNNVELENNVYIHSFEIPAINIQGFYGVLSLYVSLPFQTEPATNITAEILFFNHPPKPLEASLIIPAVIPNGVNASFSLMVFPAKNDANYFDFVNEKLYATITVTNSELFSETEIPLNMDELVYFQGELLHVKSYRQLQDDSSASNKRLSLLLYIQQWRLKSFVENKIIKEFLQNKGLTEEQITQFAGIIKREHVFDYMNRFPLRNAKMMRARAFDAVDRVEDQAVADNLMMPMMETASLGSAVETTAASSHLRQEPYNAMFTKLFMNMSMSQTQEIHIKKSAPLYSFLYPFESRGYRQLYSSTLLYLPGQSLYPSHAFTYTFMTSDLLGENRISADIYTNRGHFLHIEKYFKVQKDVYMNIYLKEDYNNEDQIQFPVVIHKKVNATTHGGLNVHINSHVTPYASYYPIEMQGTQKRQLVLFNPVISETSQENQPDSDSAEPHSPLIQPRIPTPQCFFCVSDYPPESSIPRGKSYESVVSLVYEGDDGYDAARNTIQIHSVGFPAKLTVPATVSIPGEMTYSFVIPEDIVPGSLSLHYTLYTNLLAPIAPALSGLIHEPFGCFEQTSSSVFPMLSVLTIDSNKPRESEEYESTKTNILKDDEKTTIISYIEKGLDRLFSYEIKETGGFEWFGHPPSHPALSAYGLQEFYTAKHIQQYLSSKYVDLLNDVIQRTENYLNSLRTSNGTYILQSGGIDSISHSSLATQAAYITYTLSQTKYASSLSPEMSLLFSSSSSNSTSTYIQALACLTAINVNETNVIEQLITALKQKQTEEGFITGGTDSITGSRGNGLVIETTALTLLCFAKYNSMEHKSQEVSETLQNGINWLLKQSEDGRFGTTQGTILSLSLFIEMTRTTGYTTSRRVSIDVHDEKNNIVDHSLPTLQSILKTAGKYDILIGLSGSPVKEAYTYLTISYSRKNPPNPEQYPVKLTFENTNFILNEGSIGTLSLTVANQFDHSLGMVVAVIGLPADMTLNLESLNRLTASESITSWEIRGTDLILYWTTMTSNQSKSVSIVFTVDAPGVYTGRVSYVYEYYNDAVKYYSDPIHLTGQPQV